MQKFPHHERIVMEVFHFFKIAVSVQCSFRSLYTINLLEVITKY